MPPLLSDDEYYGDNDDGDSDDSNYNCFHPRSGSGGQLGPYPQMTRFTGLDEPHLGWGSGPAFLSRHVVQEMVIRFVRCLVMSQHRAKPCHQKGACFMACCSCTA